MNFPQWRHGLLSVVMVSCLSVQHAHADYPDYPGLEPIFRAGESLADPRAALLNEQDCTAKTIGGRACLDILAGTDPYEPVTWNFRIDHPRWFGSDKFTLRITFVDEGAGVIMPQVLTDDAFNGGYSGPVRQHSHTRLNTGTVRHAWFEFTGNPEVPSKSAHAHLRISGLQHLVEIQIGPVLDNAAWQAISDNVPRQVSPMVTLSRPMELVTTAGVAVTQSGDGDLQASLDAMVDLAPLARVLGFTSIESYLIWRRIEPGQEGVFDFSFYDAVVNRLQEYGLKWFPLLVVGSAYALPDWFAASGENVGFRCVEHGLENPIQSIWSPHHKRHVTRVLKAIGEHYEPMNVLEGVRLGPSGNYGESQYPAGGNWGLRGDAMHIHIGWWAGDPHALADWQRWLKARYGDIAALNAAWDGAAYTGFEGIEILLPQVIRSRRQRLDFTQWYTDSMSDWCAWWAQEARAAMPNTPMYQSAGGWGFREAGTDYAAQAKAMVPLNGGIRLTNETDNFEQNCCATRMAITAARHYGIPIGTEPASSHTARGVAGRLFSLLGVNGTHFFTYHGNIFNHPMAVESWLNTLPLMDRRGKPLVEVALYYPETMNQYEDAAFRHLYAWGFNPRAMELRRVVDVDYMDEHLIREGFLDKYKVLVFVWGNVIEADVLAVMDAWMRHGGMILYPSFPRGALQTVEGDASVFARWSRGDSGEGAFRRFKGDMDPPSLYAEFVRNTLSRLSTLATITRALIDAERPEQVFMTAFEDGSIGILNYEEREVSVSIPGRQPIRLLPFHMELTHNQE